jgi:hypothetical protein
MPTSCCADSTDQDKHLFGDGFVQTPSNRLTLKLCARLFARSIRYELSRIWFREQWLVACCKTASNDSHDVSVADNLTFLQPGTRYNFADPFVFSKNGRTYVFLEQWATGGRGEIYCSELDQNGRPSLPRQVLARNYHLSYPFIFDWQGDTYLLPETAGNHTVELYRAVEFPWRWEPFALLLEGLQVVDPTLFRYNNTLWLFVCGRDTAEMESTELSLFFSDSLLGKWKAHPRNPIVCDVRRARPAGGLFFDGNGLIRPGQNCSKTYGYAVVLNKVEVLSKTDYREVPFKTILPKWMPNICATHTLNQNGAYLVLDAKVRVPRFGLFNRHWSFGKNNFAPAANLDYLRSLGQRIEDDSSAAYLTGL